MPPVLNSMPVIIDDLEDACAGLTPLGEIVLANACGSVRSAITDFARVHGWHIIDHGAFRHWADGLMSGDSTWLILDPLMEVDGLRPSIRRLRISRVLHGNEWKIETADIAGIAGLTSGMTLGLVDDAAWTGKTVAHVNALMRARVT